VRLEGDAETFDGHRCLRFEKDARVSDAGIIPFGDEAWEQLHRLIRSADASGIEDPPRFVRVTSLRAHDHAETRRRKIETRR
jgi:hypothetical protein